MGVPLSRALQNGGSLRAYIWKGALKVIDRVHGDGILPETPILWDSEIECLGRFRNGKGGSVYEIALNPSQIPLDAKQTLIHEVGHFLDAAALSVIPGSGWGSANNPELEDWRQATRASEAYRSLQSLIGKFTAVERGTDDTQAVNQSKAAYYLRTEELFARSYAQWIAVSSQDVELVYWYNVMAEVPSIYSTEWALEDFEPIANALGQLFEGRGWMR